MEIVEGATTLEHREFCAYNINIQQKKKSAFG